LSFEVGRQNLLARFTFLMNLECIAIGHPRDRIMQVWFVLSVLEELVKLPRERTLPPTTQAAIVILSLHVHTLIAIPVLFLQVTGLHHLTVCDYEMIYQERRLQYARIMSSKKRLRRHIFFWEHHL
jgi:hypothetical protein